MGLREIVAIDMDTFKVYCEQTGVTADKKPHVLQTLQERFGVNLNTYLRRSTSRWVTDVNIPYMLIHLFRCIVRNPGLEICEIVDRIARHEDGFDYGVTYDVMQLTWSETVEGCRDALNSIKYGNAYATKCDYLTSYMVSLERVWYNISDYQYRTYVDAEYEELLYDVTRWLRDSEYNEDLLYMLMRALYHNNFVFVPVMCEVHMHRPFENLGSVLYVDDLKPDINTSNTLAIYKRFLDCNTYYDGVITDDGEWLPYVDYNWNGYDCLRLAVQHFMCLSAGYSACFRCDQGLSTELVHEFARRIQQAPSKLIVKRDYTYQETNTMAFLNTGSYQFLYYKEMEVLLCSCNLGTTAYRDAVACTDEWKVVKRDETLPLHQTGSRAEHHKERFDSADKQ